MTGLIQFWSEKIGCSDLNLRLFFFWGGGDGMGDVVMDYGTTPDLPRRICCITDVLCTQLSFLVLACHGMAWPGR